MERIEEFLTHVDERHREALEWFQAVRRLDVEWPGRHDNGLHLVNRAKGIHKPEGMSYALSVRQTLDAPYQDHAPQERPDGTWYYRYFQEGDEPSRRDEYFSNRGLMACMRDRVPVAVLRQVQVKPRVRYHVHGLALVSGWDRGHFLLEGENNNGEVRAWRDPIAEVGEQITAKIAEPTADEREKALAAVTVRRGQPRFRQILLEAYAGKCAVTGCDAQSALEAAHIDPYRGEQSNHPANGVLLRSDIHTLFDIGLLGLHPTFRSVVLASALRDSHYGPLHRSPIREPEQAHLRPDSGGLQRHLERFGLLGSSD